MAKGNAEINALIKEALEGRPMTMRELADMLAEKHGVYLDEGNLNRRAKAQGLESRILRGIRKGNLIRSAKKDFVGIREKKERGFGSSEVIRAARMILDIGNGLQIRRILSPYGQNYIVTTQKGKKVRAANKEQVVAWDKRFEPQGRKPIQKIGNGIKRPRIVRI